MNLEANLTQLERAELLRRLEQEDIAYIFKHALTQETAYQSLLLKRRRSIHRRVAETYETLYADRVEEFASLLTQHYAEAGEHVKVLHYAILAGDHAARVYAYAEARIYYLRALDALIHLPNDKKNRRHHADVLVKLVSVSYAVTPSEQSFERLNDAESIVRSFGSREMAKEDRLRLARIHYWLGRMYVYRNETRQAIDVLLRMEDEAADSGDESLLEFPSAVIGRIMNVRGQFGAAGVLLAKAVAPLERAGSWPEWIFTVGHLGVSLAARGQYAAGLAKGQAAVTRALQVQNLTGLAEAYGLLGIIHFMGGDFARMFQAAEECIRAAEKFATRHYLYPGYIERALAESCLGNHAAANRSIATSEEIGKELSEGRVYSDWFAAVKAEVALNSGRCEDAIQLAAQAVETAQALGGIFAVGLAERTWARALAVTSRIPWKEVESHLGASTDAFKAGEACLEAARTHVAWGTLCRDRGQLDAAREHLAKAAAQFESSALADEARRARELLEMVSVP